MRLGGIKKIDLHTHIIPETWPDWNQEFGQGSWLTIRHDPDGVNKNDSLIPPRVLPARWTLEQADQRRRHHFSRRGAKLLVPPEASERVRCDGRDHPGAIDSTRDRLQLWSTCGARSARGTIPE